MSAPALPPPDSFLQLPEDAARHRLKLALGRLSSTQRHVMLLRLRGESDLDLIAVRLKLEPAAVRASLAFANAQLRMMLSDTPQDPGQNAWLLRCQALLTPRPAPTTATGTHPESSAARSAPAELADQPQQPTDDAIPSAPSPATPDPLPPGAAAAAPAERMPPSPWLLPWLPGALALLVITSLGLLAWVISATSTPEQVAHVVPSEPERMPAPSAPEAPLTAPDFSLVLLRQTQPELLENLDFHVWLSEQESFQ